MSSLKCSNHILHMKAGLLGTRLECASTERQKAEQQKGFTLIELSIVLVIIGLIVGGVLTGQDLIAAAQTRAAVGQYEKFNTSVNTFNTKFGGLPGDLISSSAEAFGFAYVAGAVAGAGDGDGFIGSSVTSVASNEGLMFWAQLYQAGFIPNALGGLPIGAAWTVADQTTQASIGNALPLSKLTQAGPAYWWVGTFSDGYNYYGISAVTSWASSTGVLTAGAGLSPVAAYDMDVKIDDGVPNTGIVQSIATSVSGSITLAQGGSVGSCINTNNAAAYGGGTTTEARIAACQIRLRFN